MSDLLYFVRDHLDTPTNERVKAGVIFPPLDTAQRDRILSETPRVAIGFAAFPYDVLFGLSAAPSGRFLRTAAGGQLEARTPAETLTQLVASGPTGSRFHANSAGPRGHFRVTRPLEDMDDAIADFTASFTSFGTSYPGALLTIEEIPDISNAMGRIFFGQYGDGSQTYFGPRESAAPMDLGSPSAPWRDIYGGVGTLQSDSNRWVFRLRSPKIQVAVNRVTGIGPIDDEIAAGVIRGPAVAMGNWLQPFSALWFYNTSAGKASGTPGVWGSNFGQPSTTSAGTGRVQRQSVSSDTNFILLTVGIGVYE